MTDDVTRPHETEGEPPPSTPATTPDEPAAFTPAETLEASTQGPAPEAAAPPVATSAVQSSTSNRGRWLLAGGIAGLAIAAAVAVVLLFGGAPSSPEALQYLPNDAAFIAEVRMDLPGDQMQALGNLLAHFPGFQDQSTLTAKIDQALTQLVDRAGDPDVDYLTDIKPLLAGPTFISVRSFEDMATASDPTGVLLVATTNGSAACASTFKGQTLTHETYRGLDLSLTSDGKAACAVEGRFFLVGDAAGVKAGLDTHAGSTGADKSARYKAARAALGLDRLATLYIDGVALGKAMPAPNPSVPLSDFATSFPEWIMAGARAENDAFVVDVVAATATGASPLPSMRTYPPVHPIALTALAPADTLLFLEAQGYTVGIQNLVVQLRADPQFADALAMLDTVGGLDGLIGWIDDIGVVVVRQGDLPAGALMLVASDAASATEKVTTLQTVLGLAALSGEITVTESTVEGIKVSTVHIPDISVLGGAIPGGAGTIPAIAVDFSIAAKDRVVILGIGEGVMPRLLGVKAGASLVDDPAYKRALAHSLPNPQSLLYVAAGASIDWLETVAVPQVVPVWPADVKAYLDPLEGMLFTSAGSSTQGSARFSITVTKP